MADANQKGLVQKLLQPKKPYFVGFNTVNQAAPPYNLNNIELIKRDIYNTFATPRGARLMLPNYGSSIHQYLFDPFDEYTKASIIEDAVEVIQSEPRVELVSIDAFQEDQTLTIAISLLFKPESVTDNMFVTFSLKDQSTF